MVTDDELEGIMRLRGSGKTHQEIADDLGLKRTTVAYQLKKLAKSPVDHSIQVIVATSFKPQETVIEFDTHSFETHRVKSTLYTTGDTLYEMRGGVIHKTSLKAPFRGVDYPKIAGLIKKHGPDWYLPVHSVAKIFENCQRKLLAIDGGIYSRWDRLGLDKHTAEKYAYKVIEKANLKVMSGPPEIPGTIHADKIVDYLNRGNKNSSDFLVQKGEDTWADLLHYSWNNLLAKDPMTQDPHRFVEIEISSIFEAAKKSVDSEIALNRLFQGVREIFPSHNPRGYGYSEAQQEAMETLERNLEKSIPRLVSSVYKDRGFAKEDILFVRKNNIGSPEVFLEFKDSGLEEFSQFQEMRGHGAEFKSYEQYQECKSLVRLLYPNPTSGGSITQSVINRNAMELENLGVLIKGNGRGNIIHPHFLYVAKAHREWPHWSAFGLNLKDILGGDEFGFNKQYRRNQEFFHATGLSPNPTNYKWVDKQSDSQLNSLKRFPSPRAATVYDTISTSPTQSLMLDSLIRIHNESKNPGPTIQDQGSMHAILSKKPFTDICVSSLESGFVERYQNGKPLLDTSKFEDLSGKDSPINKKVISAISRNAADDSLTTAWTRFEASSKELWARDLEEPLPTNGQVAVRMVDEMAKLVKFTPAMTKDLHLARQLRNDVIHGDEPREEIKPKHVRRVLEATEKIIKKLIG